MSFNYVKDWFELLSYAATIIGIPLAIYVYIKGRNEDKKLKKQEALFSSHGLYVDYLKICLANPDLNIYDTIYNKPGYSLIQKKEFIAFEILFAYLESAYHFYKDQPADFKRKTWDGWVSYIKGYINQENFITAWTLTGDEWEADFSEFMNNLIKEEKQRQSQAKDMNAQNGV